MFVLSNCTEGRRNILCCMNQHWKGKSTYKSGTSKLQQPGRLPPSIVTYGMVCLWPLRKSKRLRAAGASWEVRRSAEVQQATCRSLVPLPSLCTSPSGNVWSSPGISTTPVLCPMACSRALLELWSLSSLRAVLVPPHKPCPSHVEKGHGSISAPGVGEWRGRCGAGTQKLQPHFSTIFFPKNEKTTQSCRVFTNPCFEHTYLCLN